MDDSRYVIYKTFEVFGQLFYFVFIGWLASAADFEVLSIQFLGIILLAAFLLGWLQRTHMGAMRHR